METRRLYYDDSFVRDFTASVLSCETVAHPSRAAWEVVLDATALYPTSGGQPHDLGKLNEANVLDVRDEGEEIVHLVDRQLDLGPVQGCVDWGRRFDHMQQHSGQHLLSAMFQERYGRPTVSFHLGAEISTIDLRGDEPSDEILEGAERAANQVIFEDRPLNVRYGTADRLAALGVRKEVDREGILRAIEIEGADLQPCGGTHVKRTAQIGMMLVRRRTKMRQDWRVEFACGGRAERIARRDFRLLSRAAGSLGCAFEDVAEFAGRAISERDASFKDFRTAANRRAEAEAALVLQEISPSPSGARVIVRAFEEQGHPEYLGYFAGQIAKSENAVALVCAKDGGHLVFAQHPLIGKDMNALLKQVFQQFAGKGGGTRDFARGRLNDAASTEKALKVGRELLESE